MPKPFPAGVDRVHRTVVWSAMAMCVLVLAYTLANYARRNEPVYLWRAAWAGLTLGLLALYLRWFVRRVSELR